MPFLRTREMFQLKYDDYPSYADAYLALSPPPRLAYLQAVIDRLPLSGVTATPAALARPRRRGHDRVARLAVRACAREFARLYKDAGQARPRVPSSAALSFNDGEEIGLNSSRPGRLVWFKGGSSRPGY